ncbi:hypothetical protein PF005_g1406 [Phytophthora fragariae]|uniref:ZZ-type domain-containing protein n=2 Tax=Phytophthora fragariae TaxID=53985 RepID=A0A6A3ZHT6_9STRA|nr:hypothetical protein PF003_g5667 [Phytophthora fragariae]KAE8948928.1 hypothetical protein PF009_g1516 [Phytophthora fragariae]KAE9028382.1 hypothetical protein PF011_g1604 [Phytophthora fragariae]KAE9136358.1 hypothetical protein PF007_g2233 [Phytophthora fragariae]KAE9154830.1 hypothetical protein PF006_g1177 [Phytophthora fragariae]
MLATATLQHNLAALQAQLATLQQENSALTRDLCLKENYIQLKDQQFRVMQRRLEELEGAVAQWKDRWLQQVNAQQASTSGGSGTEYAVGGGQPADKQEDAKWTPWKSKPGTSNRAKALAQATAKLEKFSQVDRNKLQPLLTAIEQSDGSGGVDNLVFADVSEELSRILLLYLLPALLDAADGSQQLQCFSRTYRKQTMDFRVCTRKTADTTAVAAAEGDEAALTASAAAADKQPPPAPSILRSSSGDTSCETFTPLVQASPETEETEAPHLFDCVELERRGATRTSVPHGPRELHATKAMFVSRPLSNSAAARTANSQLDKLGEKPVEKASRRYTLTPKRTAPTFAVETTRTHTMTMGALPSPAQSPSSMGVLPLGSDGEVIPMPPREKESKDGKIKKIVGSVFDRLSRHKSQQSLVSNSTTSSSASPLSVPAGSTEVVGDDDESICDGCGRGPLVGVKWVCRTCRLLAGEEYELCEKCYGQGIHGKEHEDALFARVEAIVVRKCPRLASETELLHLLRVGICKANLKKFSFCLTWIADLLQCNRTTDLRARALEIAHIPPTVRSEFARLLRELLTRYRPDIELKTEWEPAAGAQHGIGPGTPGICGEGVPDELDTLRIWVKDAPLAASATGGPNTGPPALG